MTLPQNSNRIIITEIIFAENQLSLALISLSPLITNHPRILQHSRVQSSILFDLFIIRSTSFGSNKSNFGLLSLRLFSKLSSLLLLTRQPIMQKVRCHIITRYSNCLQGYQFRILFHQLSTYFFTFHSRYSSLSLDILYLALENGIPIFHTKLPSSYYLFDFILFIQYSLLFRRCKFGLSPSSVILYFYKMFY